MSELNLPAWAKIGDPDDKYSITLLASTDGYVDEWLPLLKIDKPDQYWLEVAYQCAKMDLQRAIEGTEFDPRAAGKSAAIKFDRSEKYALNKHPTGKGAAAATQGREAREHYRRVRGRLPF